MLQLATDIATYIQTRDSNFRKLRELDVGTKEMSMVLLSLLMTSSDVSDCVKKWEDNLVSAVSLPKIPIPNIQIWIDIDNLLLH